MSQALWTSALHVNDQQGHIADKHLLPDVIRDTGPGASSDHCDVCLCVDCVLTALRAAGRMHQCTHPCRAPPGHSSRPQHTARSCYLRCT